VVTLGERIDISKVFSAEQLEELLKKVPTDLETNMLLAEKYLQSRNFSQALRPLNTLIPLVKEKIREARAKKGSRIAIKAVLLRNRYTIDEFEMMYRRQLEGLATCYMELGDFDKAMRLQEENLEIDDSDSNSWNMYGVLLSRMHDDAGAERAFLLSLANNPQYDTAWVNLAKELRVLSGVENEQRVVAFLKSNKEIESAISLVVDLLYQKGEFDFIERLFQKYFKKHTFDQESFYTLCNGYIYQERYAEVEKLLQKLISKYPSNGSFKWQLSRVFALQDKKEESMRALGRIQKDHFQFSQMRALKSAMEEGTDVKQTLKVFFQYFRGNNNPSSVNRNQGLYLRYLTEVKVKAGTTVGDLIHILVRGDIEKISPYVGLPSVHHTLTLTPGGGSVYCEAMPCMLNEIKGDNIASFSPSYHTSSISRNRTEAIPSDLLFSGDILLLQKKALRSHPMGVSLTSALALEGALKLMIDEEKKGHTQFNLRFRNNSSDSTSKTKRSVSQPNMRFIDELLKTLD
jgi:tetratricopeptide (TPR) repeat protein